MKKVLLVFGGPSNEHLISCKSIKSILENIDYKKYDVSVCGISESLEWYKFNDSLEMLEDGSWINSSNNEKIENIVEFFKTFDVVFPVIHGTLGEDGKLASMLDIFNVKYVGSKGLAHGIGYDKHYTKLICKSLNINQIDYIVLYKNEKKYIKKVEDNLSYPVIVKPCCSGSSIGVNIVNNRKELSKFIKEAFIFDDKILVEKYIEKKREFECGVLEDKKIIVSSVGEIINDDNIYDYESKYIKKADVVVPAFISSNINNQIKKWSIDIFNILGCSGLARIDFIYDTLEDILYFNEINTIPGFTDISMYSKVFNYDGISFKSLIDKLIDNAK